MLIGMYCSVRCSDWNRGSDGMEVGYSTVTLFAKFLGQSTCGDEGGIDNTQLEERRTYE